MTEFDQIACFENLYQAHKKARRGKQKKKEVILYETRLTENLMKLSYHLYRKSYHVRGYYKFIIHDPKTREIQALCYADRIVQHSLCDNVLGPYLDKRLIYDNAACRLNKGTHFAMNRLTYFLRRQYNESGTNGYILKCDIRKYFDSISHPVLLGMVKDMKLTGQTKWLLEMIIKSYCFEPERGIPMGNQTSQWFALFYLDGLDRLVKEKLRIKYYSRYMDDIVLVHKDKDYLKECLVAMQQYVEEVLHLSFNEKTQIHSVKEGVDYLGFHFFLTNTGKVIRKLRQSGKKRLKKKLRGLKSAYRKGKTDSVAIRRSVVSYRGHLNHGHTFRLQRNIWNNFILTKGGESKCEKT